MFTWMILYLQRSFIVCCLYDIKILFIHLIMNISIVFLGGGNLKDQDTPAERNTFANM